MSVAAAIWLSILAVSLIFEGWTIWGDDEPNTTLSFFVIRARAVGTWRVLIFSGMAWLTWHWGFEPDELASFPDDDIAVVVAMALGTLLRRTPRERMR